MKKRWAAALLALTLCTAEALPAAALEESMVPESIDPAGNMAVDAAMDSTESMAPDAIISSEEALIPEETTPVDPQQEHIEAPEGEAENDPEITEDLLPEEPVAGSEQLSEESAAESDQFPAEPEKISEYELVIDLSDAWNSAMIDGSPTTVAEQVEIPIDEEHFPDKAFRDYLTGKDQAEEQTGNTAYQKVRIDTDENGSLSADEIAAVTEIDVIGKGVGSLSGIEYFTGLKTLLCDNNALTALDVSRNTKLTTLTCSGNQLTALDLNNNSKLISLVCSGNQLTSLALGKNKGLQDLRCAGNQLQTLDLSNNSLILWLDCSQNKLSTLDVSNHTRLSDLFCNSNQLSSLKLTGAAGLQWLDCSDNLLTELDVTDVLNVKTEQDSATNLLNCANNRLTSLNVNNKSYFKGLVCSGNMLSELDLSADPDLRQLECANNALTSLRLPQGSSASSKIKLQTLDCSGNHLTSLDLSQLSITETTVLPNCSGQSLTINLEETDSGYQADLNAFVGDSTLLRLSETELETCAEKSVLGNLILLTQEGELEDGVLTFPKESVPETIELVSATGYKKKAWETDLLLELSLHCHIHNIERIEKAPGCTADGLLQEKCTQCNAVIKETILPATGHSYGAYTVTREATVFETGVKSRTCTACGLVQDEPIPKLNNGTLALTAGETLKLKPLLTAATGQQGIRYKSSNKKVATVSAKGVVKGNKKGSAKISIRSDSGKYVVKVKVTTPAVKKIKHIPAKKKLQKGKTFQLEPRLAPAGCSQKITYSSSNKKVATVTAKGKVKARGRGKARITVTAGNVKKVCRIIVR